VSFALNHHTKNSTEMVKGNATNSIFSLIWMYQLPLDTQCMQALKLRSNKMRGGADTYLHLHLHLPTSLNQLLYRLSRDNLKHFYLPNLSHHFKLLSRIFVPCPTSYLAYATLISTTTTTTTTTVDLHNDHIMAVAVNHHAKPCTISYLLQYW